MPEYMISGDASNGNYASSMVAESPFVKNCEAEQSFYERRFLRVFWRVVESACKAERIPVDYQTVKWLIEIKVGLPPVATRNKLEETNRSKLLVDMGAKSVKTVAAEEGLDYEQEVEDGAKPVVATGPGGAMGRGEPGGATDDGEGDQPPDPNNPNAPAGPPAPTGEYMGLSRQQWVRNGKAIGDVLDGLTAGEKSEVRARVELGALGLSAANIDLLIADAADGKVDTELPVVESAALVECGGKGGTPGPCPSTTVHQADKAAGGGGERKKPVAHALPQRKQTHTEMRKFLSDSLTQDAPATKIQVTLSPESTTKKINKLIGVKSRKPYAFVLTGSYAKHIINEHGPNGNKLFPGDQPVIEKDFHRLRHIVVAPDSIEPGNKANSVLMTKRWNGTTFIAVAAFDKSGEFSITSMRKTASKKGVASGRRPKRTSESTDGLGATRRKKLSESASRKSSVSAWLDRAAGFVDLRETVEPEPKPATDSPPIVLAPNFAIHTHIAPSEAPRVECTVQPAQIHIHETQVAAPALPQFNMPTIEVKPEIHVHPADVTVIHAQATETVVERNQEGEITRSIHRPLKEE